MMASEAPTLGTGKDLLISSSIALFLWKTVCLSSEICTQSHESTVCDHSLLKIRTFHTWKYTLYFKNNLSDTVFHTEGSLRAYGVSAPK